MSSSDVQIHLPGGAGVRLAMMLDPTFRRLHFDTKIDAAALEAAARERRLPLKKLDVERLRAAGVHAGRLVLSRPDQQVPWRGDRVPDNPATLIDRVRGAEH